jgi:hypothetical protein
MEVVLHADGFVESNANNMLQLRAVRGKDRVC